MSKVRYRKKSHWQKKDCLFCDRSSTLEACCVNAVVRCCGNKECKQKAAKLAKEAGHLFLVRDAPEPIEVILKPTKLQLLTDED